MANAIRRTDRDGVALIAHRGFAGVYPENTVAAVRRATSGDDPRPDAIEVDVMASADGEVVVFHDSELGRVTDAPPALAGRTVWETPYDTLRELDVLGTGQPVPRLSEVLDAVPPDVAVNVEFKNPGTADVRFDDHLEPGAVEERKQAWLGFAEDVLSIATAYDNDLLVSSFCEGALAAVREVDPDVPVAAVFHDSVADGLGIARRHDCEAIHPPGAMIPGTPGFDAGPDGPAGDVDLVEVAHEEGRAVNAWTVDTWRQATALRAAGVDGVIADYPGVVRFDGATASPPVAERSSRQSASEE